MEAPVCRNCKVFFGCQEGLCSKCFREAKCVACVESGVAGLIMTPKAVEEVKEAVKIEVAVRPDRCFSCNKLLGPVNFKCKCSNFFCTRHRHPEEHSCQFDHKSEGIKKLSEENPLVQAPKFTRL